jgi:hypothetical protein
MVRILLTLASPRCRRPSRLEAATCAGRDDQVPAGLRQIIPAAPAGAIAPGNPVGVASAARERHRSPDYEFWGSGVRISSGAPAKLSVCACF